MRERRLLERPQKQTYGGQAEAVRVPLADGTLVKVPGGVDEAPYPSLLTLSDVYGTGWLATVAAQVRPGSSVTVVGDGAAGLMAVLSAQQQGAEQIILMARRTPTGPTWAETSGPPTWSSSAATTGCSTSST